MCAFVVLKKVYFKIQNSVVSSLTDLPQWKSQTQRSMTVFLFSFLRNYSWFLLLKVVIRGNHPKHWLSEYWITVSRGNEVRFIQASGQNIFIKWAIYNFALYVFLLKTSHLIYVAGLLTWKPWPIAQLPPQQSLSNTYFSL